MSLPHNDNSSGEDCSDDEAIALDGIQILASEEELISNSQQQPQPTRLSRHKHGLSDQSCSKDEKRAQGSTLHENVKNPSTATKVPAAESPPSKKQRLKRIEQIDPTNGVVVAQYNSIKEGAAAVGVFSTALCARLTDQAYRRTTLVGGFKWRYYSGEGPWNPTLVAKAAPFKNRSVQTFDESIKALLEYKSKHGHVDVPQLRGGSLGRFVHNTRQVYKAYLDGKDTRGAPLSDDAVLELQNRWERLEAIGFSWTGGRTNYWEVQMTKLRAYKEKHGHCMVSTRDGTLGRWVKNLRMQYRDADRSNLDEATCMKLEQLDEVGFVWEPRKRPSTWEAQMARLRAYKEKHGHCKVSTRDGTLGRWVKNLRMQYRDADRSNLDEATRIKLEQLDDLGFVWEPTKEPNTNHGATSRKRARSANSNPLSSKKRTALTNPSIPSGAVC